jgi:hypothetical protein
VEEEALVAQFTSLKNVGLLDGLLGVGMMKWMDMGQNGRPDLGDHRCECLV